MPLSRRPVRPATGFVIALSCLAAAGCESADSPVMLDEAGLQQQATVVASDTIDIRTAPTFTPFTEAPSIRNREEVISAMARSYPPLLRDAGIGGTVRVWFFINDQGIVEQVRLDESSGHEALDEAALNVAGVYAFEPAKNDGKDVPVWVTFPITFQVR